MHVHVFCYVSLQWSTFDQITSLCYLAVLFSPPIDFLITLHPILGIFSEGHIWPKNLSKVSSIRHGRRQEMISRPIYCRKKQKNRKQIIVYDTGLVVNSSFPHLEASSDSKV